MKIERFALDWRSEDKILQEQITKLNKFTKNITVHFFAVEDEFIYVFYSEIIPQKQTEFEAISLSDGNMSVIKLAISCKSTIINAVVRDGVLIFAYEQ